MLISHGLNSLPGSCVELALTNIFATSVREWGLAERENPPNIRARSNMIDIV